MNPARALPSLADLAGAAAMRLAAAGIETARLDAEVLLAAALGMTRSGLYARWRELADADVEARFEALVDRRAGREPVAYLTGVQEFWSLEFAVTPAVLIPRPETELLVEIAAAVAGSRASICDVGTGSGCIAVALAHELPSARVLATDRSADALAVARRNAARHGCTERVTFLESDLFGAAGAERFDVVVSNPPYLRPTDPTSPETAFEPRSALVAGPDGLAIITQLIAAAPRHLRPGGWLVVEFGIDQAEPVRALAERAGLAEIRIERDLAGLPRALVARAR